MESVIAIDKDPDVGAALSAPSKLSWGAIFGGTFVALGVWAMLLALGLAIGLTVVNPNNPETARTAATFTGLWSAIALLVSLFVGGIAASRAAGWVDRSTGAIHGAVLWGFTTIAGALLLFFALRAGVGAAMGLGMGVARTASSAVAAGTRDNGALSQMLGIDSDDLLTSLNRRLRAEGKPVVTRGQLEAAARDVVDRALREGRLDRDLLVTSISRNTNLSTADVEQLTDRIQDRVDQKLGRLETMKRDAQYTALRVADAAAEAMWWSFIGLALSLIAALAGATLGVSRRQRSFAAGERLPLATTREAHP